MNWYQLIKMAQIQGEYWIDQFGNAHYADGDVGDINHEGYVLRHIVETYLDLNEFDDPSSSEFIESYIQQDWASIVEHMIRIEGFIPEEERQLALHNMNNGSPINNGETFFEIAVNNTVLSDILKINGASGKEADVASGHGDAVLYAKENWGWKRLAGQNVETYTLSRGDLKKISDGLYEAYGESALIASFNIFVHANNKWFQDIPYSMIESGSIKDIKDKAFVGW